MAALAALGALTIATPYLGKELGLRIDVPSKVEVVDHVVPGVIVVVLSALWLVVLSGRARATGSLLLLAAAGVFFLASLWLTLTHVPTLIEAVGGDVPWGPALFHSAAGPPMLGLSLWLLVPQLREPQ